MRIGALALALAVAGASHAMTPEDCREVRERVGSVVEAVKEVTLASDVTPDGWCRVVSEPVAGLEWQAEMRPDGFQAAARLAGVEVPGLGLFGFSAAAVQDGGGLALGPVSLVRQDGDTLHLTARTGGIASAAGGFGPMTLSGAELRVSGDGGLAGDILGWLFRLDAEAARANFAVARDQRAAMETWLADLPPGIGDAASRRAFRDLVDAYPNARGTAVLSVPAEHGIAVGPLVAAVLFGAPFSRDEAATMARSAGLTLGWTPE